MQNLNTIPVAGKFLDVANKANTNFLAIKTAIEQLELSVTRSKGFFSSATALTNRYPSPVVGDWAVVQDTSVSPAAVYIWRCTTNGTWSNSGTEWPGGNVDLAEYAKKAELPEIEDNLTTELTGKALDAHQGNVLSQLNTDIIRSMESFLEGDVMTTWGAQRGFGRFGYKDAEGNNTDAGIFNNIVVESCTTQFFLCSSKSLLKQGTIIHYYRKATAERNFGVGFCKANPNDYYSENGTFVGLVIDRVDIFRDTVFDLYFVMPFDGYFLYSSFYSNWEKASNITSYEPEYLKNCIGDLQGMVGDLQGMDKRLLNAIANRHVPSWKTTTSAPFPIPGNNYYVDNLTDLRITKDGFVSSGSTQPTRYHVRFFSFQKGVIFRFSSRLHPNTSSSNVWHGFMRELPKDNEGNILTGDALRTALLAESSPHVLENIEVESASRDDKKGINIPSETVAIMPYDGYLVLYYYHNSSSGSITWDTSTWNCEIFEPVVDWKEDVNRIGETVKVLTDSLIKNNVVGVKYETVVPSAEETYNLYFAAAQSTNFCSGGSASKRLTYFPKCKVAGGSTVTIKYTGLYAFTLYQMAHKEGVEIDTVPNRAYTTKEVTSLGKFLAPSFTPEEGEEPTRTVTFTLHPKCERIALVMGAGNNEKTQHPVNITDYITEITLPVYNTKDIDFSIFTKNTEFELLFNRVEDNAILWTTSGPGVISKKGYIIENDGTITKKNNTYVTSYYKTPFNTGDRIHFYAEDTISTGRAKIFAFTASNPAEEDSLLDLSPVTVLEHSAPVITVTDEEGNFVKHIHDFEVVIPQDNVYVLFYQYNANWVKGSQVYEYSYSGALKRAVEGLLNSTSDNEDVIRQASYVANKPTIDSLNLLHYSDIHGDKTAVATIQDAIEKYAAYIDDVLCTGDSVLYYADGTGSFPEGATWWKNCGLAERSLFVLGNHDNATAAATEFDQKEDSGAWDGKGQDWGFDTYFKDYADGLGITLPEGYNDPESPYYKACFWHKDYTLGTKNDTDGTSRPSGIRIIGLDCIHRFDGVVDPITGDITTEGLKYKSNVQEKWLIEKLNETLDLNSSVYGFHVIVACHYPIDDFDGDNEEWDDAKHKFTYNQRVNGGRVMSAKTSHVVNFHWENTNKMSLEAKFNMRNRVDRGYREGKPYYWYDDPVAQTGKKSNYTKGDSNNMGEIIKNWMDNGGHFIAWLCGHTHIDLMYYSTKYPDILCIVIDQAGCLRGTNTGDRNLNANSRTCANYISVDTQNGLIKIVRIGYNMNRLMNSHRYLCYDFVNKKVLNEG